MENARLDVLALKIEVHIEVLDLTEARIVTVKRSIDVQGERGWWL